MTISPMQTSLIFQGQKVASDAEFISVLPTELFIHILGSLPDMQSRNAFSALSRYWNNQNSEVLEREQKKIVTIASRFHLVNEPKNWKVLYEVQETILLIIKNLDLNKENIIEVIGTIHNPEIRDRAIINLLDDQRNRPLTCYSQILKLATGLNVKKQIFFHYLINTNQKNSPEKKMNWSYMFIEPNEDTNLVLCSIGSLDGNQAKKILKHKGDWLVRFSPNQRKYYLSVKEEMNVVHAGLTSLSRIRDALERVGYALEISRQMFEYSKEEVLATLIDDLKEENNAEMLTIFHALLESNFDESVLSVIKGNSFYQTELKNFSVGTLERPETEKLLSAHRKKSWLIRYSTNAKGYVLSIHTSMGSQHKFLKDGSVTVRQLFTKDKISLSKSYLVDKIH